ncbi:MAG: GNAT family N-acetyltransferase [Candidatus Dormiibacterota bacterium]
MFSELFRSTGESDALDAKWASSLAEVDRQEWDQISQHCGLYLSYPFLLAIEESEATRASYLLLRDGKGCLAAGLPMYQWDGSRDPGLDHYEPFGSGARWVLGRRARREPWLPTLLAGSRAGYSTEFAVNPESSCSKRSVVERLLGGAAELAETAGCASLGVMWLTSAAARETYPCLRRPEYLILAGPNCAIEIEWDSFAQYLSHLSHSRRHSALREQSRFRESGLEVEVTDLRSCLDQLPSLAANLQEKYGHASTDVELAAQLEAQARHLNSESRVLLCRRRGRLVAFSLFYRWRDCLYGRLAGFDYTATAGSDAYFNLAFYIPIQLALDENLRQIKLGMASWKAKVMRGASMDPAWTLVCPPGPVRGPFSRAARGWGKEGGAEWWAQQFPGLVNWRQDWRWTGAGLAGNDPATIRPQ